MDELRGHFLEDLSVGMTEVMGRTVTETDITLFAGVTGDTNPVHINQSYAGHTLCMGRSAQGMLSAGLISAVLGTKLPGPGCIYLSQNLKFRAPVKIGDTVVARVTVTEVVPEKKRVVVSTVCTVGNTVVVEGEAMLMVASKADFAEAAE